QPSDIKCSRARVVTSGNRAGGVHPRDARKAHGGERTAGYRRNRLAGSPRPRAVAACAFTADCQACAFTHPCAGCRDRLEEGSTITNGLLNRALVAPADRGRLADVLSRETDRAA